MANKKKFRYIGVINRKGHLKLVTDYSNENNVCYWKDTDKPIEIGTTDFKDMVIGLTWNGWQSMICEFPYEITEQFLYGDDNE